MGRRRISIAIMALGGQGGGVLAGWILDMAESNRWRAQGTSVPGVAQRTGSTVYYIEMLPDDGTEPMLALMPVPGDVDIVIASELMESGRAILRGFVTNDRTTLIASTHRIYAISEKAAMGDGMASSERILEGARVRAKRFVGFDMDEGARRAGSVISSVLFGALAGSAALPFPRSEFEAAIERSGIAVKANLDGFALGFAAEAADTAMLPAAIVLAAPLPTTDAGHNLAARIIATIPKPAKDIVLHGAARLCDYQDAKYASLYMDRLERIVRVDNGRDGFALTGETARHLALWMSYEDVIRVADLKTRSQRTTRVRREVRADREQLVGITEFLHPRLHEICDILPAPVGRYVLRSSALQRLLEPLFAKGRHIDTTGILGFLLLTCAAGLRRLRPRSLRYAEEQQRIEEWLALISLIAKKDPDLATEIARSQTLIKGYGDTFARGLGNFRTLMDFAPRISASQLHSLRTAALEDEKGAALAATISRMGLEPPIPVS